jgi:hypothetical protein
MTYSQLTPEDRGMISTLRKGGYRISDIAQVREKGRDTHYSKGEKTGTPTHNSPYSVTREDIGAIQFLLNRSDASLEV